MLGFLPRWLSVDPGSATVWVLADSGKKVKIWHLKCHMTLGDSNLIWIQVTSLESEVKVRHSCPTLATSWAIQSMEFSR